MVFNKFLLLTFLLLLNQGAFILAQPELIPCNVENPSPDNICTMEYNPVCAFHAICLSDTGCLGTTVGNACVACYQEGYSFYTEGECPGDGEDHTGEEETEDDIIWWCPNNEFEIEYVCTSLFDPVCAYNADEEDSSGVTVGNICQACHQQGFDYYIKGACPGDEIIPEEEENARLGGGDGAIYCDSDIGDPSETVCTDEYAPVCAFRPGNADGTTVGNSCQACYQFGAEWYYEGECVI